MLDRIAAPAVKRAGRAVRVEQRLQLAPLLRIRAARLRHECPARVSVQLDSQVEDFPQSSFNNSFESPDASGYGYSYDPSIADQGGAGWNFTPSGAYVLNASTFLIGDTVPDGSQVGALQIFNGDTSGSEISISQSLTGITWATKSELLYGHPCGSARIGVRRPVRWEHD